MFGINDHVSLLMPENKSKRDNEGISGIKSFEGIEGWDSFSLNRHLRPQYRLESRPR